MATEEMTTTMTENAASTDSSSANTAAAAATSSAHTPITATAAATRRRSLSRRRSSSSAITAAAGVMSTREPSLLLHHAVFRNDVSELRRLIALHAYDIDAVDCYGNTPLHIAVMLHHCECIDVLLNAHAKCALKNALGWSAIHEATSIGDRCVIAQLWSTFKQRAREQQELQGLFAHLQSLPNFTLTLQWSLNSWLPLIGRFLPRDSIRISKYSTAMRIDCSMLEFKGMKWIYHPYSFIIAKREEEETADATSTAATDAATAAAAATTAAADTHSPSSRRRAFIIRTIDHESKEWGVLEEDEEEKEKQREKEKEKEKQQRRGSKDASDSATASANDSTAASSSSSSSSSASSSSSSSIESDPDLSFILDDFQSAPIQSAFSPGRLVFEPVWQRMWSTLAGWSSLVGFGGGGGGEEAAAAVKEQQSEKSIAQPQQQQRSWWTWATGSSDSSSSSSSAAAAATASTAAATEREASKSKSTASASRRSRSSSATAAAAAASPSTAYVIPPAPYGHTHSSSIVGRWEAKEYIVKNLRMHVSKRFEHLTAEEEMQWKERGANFRNVMKNPFKLKSHLEEAEEEEEEEEGEGEGGKDEQSSSQQNEKDDASSHAPRKSSSSSSGDKGSEKKATKRRRKVEVVHHASLPLPATIGSVAFDTYFHSGNQRAYSAVDAEELFDKAREAQHEQQLKEGKAGEEGEEEEEELDAAAAPATDNTDEAEGADATAAANNADDNDSADAQAPPPTLATGSFTLLPSTAGEKYIHLGRPIRGETTKKKYTLKLYMADASAFPLSIDTVITMVRLLFETTYPSVTAKFEAFCRQELPPGFPVRLTVPVIPTLSADLAISDCQQGDDITFVDFRGEQQSADTYFNVPADYKKEELTREEKIKRQQKYRKRWKKGAAVAKKEDSKGGDSKSES